MNAYGLYKGIVSNNTDPEGFNRLKAICPQVLGDATSETDWAWPAVPSHRTCSVYSGGGTGVSLSEIVPPNPGVGVWLAFEGGDIEVPIWIGVWQ